MIDWLTDIDTNLFFHINHCARNGFFDWLMPILRNKYTWIPLYLVVVALFIRKHKMHAVYVIGYALLCVLLADQISAHVIKPLVGRLRPCNDPALQGLVHTLVDCGSGKSFVSSHAANHFALGIYFIMNFAKPSNRFFVTLGFVFWAGLICFASVYVGVHYPFDVLFGALLGLGIGYGLGWANRYTLCYRSGKFL